MGAPEAEPSPPPVPLAQGEARAEVLPHREASGDAVAAPLPDDKAPVPVAHVDAAGLAVPAAAVSLALPVLLLQGQDCAVELAL